MGRNAATSTSSRYTVVIGNSSQTSAWGALPPLSSSADRQQPIEAVVDGTPARSDCGMTRARKHGNAARNMVHLLAPPTAVVKPLSGADCRFCKSISR